MLHRDSAQCKLMARNAANNITTSNNQSFTATTYNYGGGIQNTRIDPDSMEYAVNNVITGLQQSVENSRVYELCMESKGYYKKRVSSYKSTVPLVKKRRINKKYNSKYNNKNGDDKKSSGQHCKHSLDCRIGLLCSQISNKCVSQEGWLEDSGKSNQRTGEGETCYEHNQCGDTLLCDHRTHTCIPSIEYIRKYPDR